MKRINKIILGFAGIVFAVVLFDALAILLIANWAPELKKADAIIVLGAAINTPALKNRTEQGLKVYEQGLANTIVFSGGKISDSDISEAEFMKKIAEKKGIEANIILEDQSHSTYENIFNSKKLLPESDSVIIISDNFHLARAVLVAKRAGFQDVQWSGPDEKYYSKESSRFYYAREFVAMISYLPKFIFGR